MDGMLRNNIEKIRLRLGYRREQDFADFLGIKQYNYSKYANNKRQPSLKVLYEATARIKKKHNIELSILDWFYEE